MNFSKVNNNNYLKYLEKLEKISLQDDTIVYNDFIKQVVSYMRDDFPKTYLEILEKYYKNTFEFYKTLGVKK